MSAIKYTHYVIKLKNGEVLEHVDVFSMPIDEIVDALLSLKGLKRESIKEVNIVYDIEKPTTFIKEEC